jgi:RNA polymerase sigma-70 factor (ECF subfamily)
MLAHESSASHPQVAPVDYWSESKYDRLGWGISEAAQRESLLPFASQRPEPSDGLERELVERARAGDGEALGQLYDHYFPRVYHYVLARTGHSAEAEDVTEDIFVRVLSGIGRFQWTHAPFSAWIFRIARNQLVSHLRRNGARRGETSIPESMVDTSPDPFSRVETKLSFDQVFEASRDLPNAQREVIWLRFAAGLSVGDTARVLGKREGNVKVLQHQAIASLRKLLAPPEDGRRNNGGS